MNYLVLCPCSHPLDHHSDAGCSGGPHRPRCPCPLNQAEALDKAIDRVSSFRGWRPMEAAQGGD